MFKRINAYLLHNSHFKFEDHIHLTAHSQKHGNFSPNLLHAAVTAFDF